MIHSPGALLHEMGSEQWNVFPALAQRRNVNRENAQAIYAMALPERYDVACGAYAFTLIVTLAVSGDYSIPILASRAWETFLGGAFGLGAATLLLPLRASTR